MKLINRSKKIIYRVNLQNKRQTNNNNNQIEREINKIKILIIIMNRILTQKMKKINRTIRGRKFQKIKMIMMIIK